MSSTWAGEYEEAEQTPGICRVESSPPALAFVTRFRSAVTQIPRNFFHRYASLAANLRGIAHGLPGLPFAMYDNGDDNAIDVEAGVFVGAGVSVFDGCVLEQLPGRRVATVVHVGPYESLGTAYGQLMQWADERQLARNGRFMEVYLDSPCDTPESRLRTRLVMPVQSLSDQLSSRRRAPWVATTSRTR